MLLFIPAFETVFVDARNESMLLVEDGELLKILQRAYKGKGESNRDYNLSKNRTVLLDNFVDALEWDDFCQRGRVVSEELLRGRGDFVEMCIIGCECCYSTGKPGESIAIALESAVSIGTKFRVGFG